MNLKAAIFDMDGLLVDSEPIWRKVEIDCFKQAGIVLTEDDCRKTKVLRIDEVVDYWFQFQPWKNISKSELENSIVDRMEEELAANSVALPGVFDTINACKKMGLKLGIASSKERLIKAVVRGLRLENDIE